MRREASVRKNFEVTAFVRTPSKLQIHHEHLHIIQGDCFNKEAVAQAIAGHEAVVSCLGSSLGMKKSTELQQMTKNIVDGMREHSITRIVYTASAGIHKEVPGISGKLVMTMLKNPLLDHQGAVDYIVANKLNYTIARPMGLTNKALTGNYKEASTGVPEKARTISRADVADFIVKVLGDSTYDRTSIGISD